MQSSRLDVRVVSDIDDIKKILCNSDVYNSITDDECPSIKDFEPPVNDDFLYVGGYVKDEVIALMVYHKYKDGNKCHVQVLPEHRKEYAKKFGEQSLLFRGTLPLYAEIPDLYKNVLDFALMNDFKIVDVMQNDYIKNGKTYNVNVLRYK